jgi:hypothetical protein
LNGGLHGSVSHQEHGVSEQHTLGDLEALLLAFRSRLESLYLEQHVDFLRKCSRKEAWDLPRLTSLECISWPALIAAPRLRRLLMNSSLLHDAFPPAAEAETKFPQLESLVLLGAVADSRCLRHWRSLTHYDGPVAGWSGLNLLLRSLPRLQSLPCRIGAAMQSWPGPEALVAALPGADAELKQLTSLRIEPRLHSAAFLLRVPSLPALRALELYLCLHDTDKDFDFNRGLEATSALLRVAAASLVTLQLRCWYVERTDITGACAGLRVLVRVLLPVGCLLLMLVLFCAVCVRVFAQRGCSRCSARSRPAVCSGCAACTSPAGTWTKFPTRTSWPRRPAVRKSTFPSRGGSARACARSWCTRRRSRAATSWTTRAASCRCCCRGRACRLRRIEFDLI